MFGFPYRPADRPYPPFWGPVSSTTNFCEEDYMVTSYVAELINTLTNLTYVYYASYGVRKNWGHKGWFLRDLPYLGILGVGLGSIIFHASLKYYTQWLDDLSMLLAVSLVLHRAYTAGTSTRFTVLSGLALTLVLFAFGVYHCMTDEVAGHNLFFAIEIIAVGWKTRSIVAKRITEPALKRQMSRLTLFGGVVFVSGYLIWILDHAICSDLNKWKRTVGMPWSFVLELHGYWHIFTGIGAYVFISEVEYLTGDEAGEPLGGKFAWPVPWIVDGTVGEETPTLPIGSEYDPLLPKARAASRVLVTPTECVVTDGTRVGNGKIL